MGVPSSSSRYALDDYTTSVSQSVASRFAFQPPKKCSYQSDRDVIHIHTTIGSVAAYFFSCDNATHTILYSHGNAEDIGQMKFWYKSLATSTQCNIIAYDYSGFGLSSGTASIDAMHTNITSVHEWLQTNKKIQDEKIILYGRSLGSCPTLWLANKVNVAGIFLQSPLASVSEFLHLNLQVDVLDNISAVRKLLPKLPPTMIVHGTDDEILSVNHVKQLLTVGPLIEERMITGGKHNDLEVDYYPVIFLAFQDLKKKIQTVEEQLLQEASTHIHK